MIARTCGGTSAGSADQIGLAAQDGRERVRHVLAVEGARCPASIS